MAATERLEARERTSQHVRFGVLALLAVVVLAAAIGQRVAAEGTPPLIVHRIVPAYVRLSGNAPVLAWPAGGQAAVEVEGVGSLGTSGSSTPVPIASVAKVMTAYLTLLQHPLAAGEGGFVMTITPADVADEQQRRALGESTVGVRAGERITERQALEALLLPSANNIAAMLAVYDAGGTAAFVARMNATARGLGMVSTTYTDPSGFEPRTVSTAADQLRLARVALRQPAFAEIVAEPSAELPVAGTVANYNGLAGWNGYVGVKTGSDRAAGGCLVFAKRVTVGDRRLTVLGVVLGQRDGSLIPAALLSGERLGDSAAAALRVRTALPAGTPVLTASNADGRRTTVVTTRALREIGWAGLAFPVRVVVRASLTQAAAGERIATVTVRGASPASARAVAAHPLGRPSLGWRLQHLL